MRRRHALCRLRPCRLGGEKCRRRAQLVVVGSGDARWADRAGRRLPGPRSLRRGCLWPLTGGSATAAARGHPALARRRQDLACGVGERPSPCRPRRALLSLDRGLCRHRGAGQLTGPRRVPARQHRWRRGLDTPANRPTRRARCCAGLPGRRRLLRQRWPGRPRADARRRVAMEHRAGTGRRDGARRRRRAGLLERDELCRSRHGRARLRRADGDLGRRPQVEPALSVGTSREVRARRRLRRGQLRGPALRGGRSRPAADRPD
jgi:hypothetical protein